MDMFRGHRYLDFLYYAMKHLVIVESPTKAKTISRFLGKEYKVESSYGHIRDLPKSKLGVDVANKFEPDYVVTPKAKARVKKLKALAKGVDTIYFATDEDREGEAIAWHLAYLLKPKKSQSKRIVFHEITKTAILEAIANPREIDRHLVDAQQARRVLDRLVGYELSPFLWKKIRYGLSAGRVQSVAVRLIVDRELEIEAFNKQEYWTIEAELHPGSSAGDADIFRAKLLKRDGKSIPKLGIDSKKAAQTILDELDGATYRIDDIQKTKRSKKPFPPFTTSTLQQEAARRFGFSAKQTMMIAQQLYEGISLGKNQIGLITYMRTDSTNLSKQFTSAVHTYVTGEFGKQYLPEEARAHGKKSKHSQEAHEAIRPTSVKRTPEDVADHLDPRQQKLYGLIWRRAIASQMSDAIFDATRIDIGAKSCLFRANGSVITFDGYLRVYNSLQSSQSSGKDQDVVLPKMAVGDDLSLIALHSEQHFTEPPARYSEASLVKALEEHGIGRPSTYAPIINTIQQRQYVEKIEKRFHPTDTGRIVNKLLTEHFPDIVDVTFTASIEKDFDHIASGEKEWVPMIESFYGPFKKHLQKKDKEVSKEDVVQEKTDEKCETCGSDMIIKFGRFGKFMACSNYPTCKTTKPLGEEKKLTEELAGKTCPECGGDVVVKRGRFGPFLGCSNYPTCKHIEKIEKKVGVSCPSCKKGDIIEKRSKRGRTFYACNTYPDCTFALWQKPNGETCPDSGDLLVFAAKGKIKCSNKECGFEKLADGEDSAEDTESA
jgi:DNA topoisomerase I